MSVSNKKRFLVGFTLIFLTGVLLVTLVDVPQFLDKTISGSLRASVLRTAKIVIPLKDRLLGRTIADKLVRIQTTGACQFCDLKNADFSGMDLHATDLRRVDLSRANLKEANLSKSNLTEANLKGANLSGAVLVGARLRGADLVGVHLTGVILTDVNLTGVDLTGVDLSSANLAGAGLSDANLSGADLSQADLAGADLSQADLSGANLTMANLKGANLSEGELGRADLGGANLTGTNLTGANLTGANLGKTVLKGANLIGTDLGGANLGGANLTGINLSEADLTGAILKRALLIDATITDATIGKETLDQALLCNTTTIDGTLSGCDLRGVDLSSTNLAGADLSGTNLSGVNLSGMDLTEVNLSGADLTGADLTGAYLTGVYLTGANLTGANLSGVDLTGKDLTNANLTNANLVNTNLARTYLYNAKLVDADLSEANLIGASLSGADLTGANLHGANLYGINLKGRDRYLSEGLMEIKESGNYSGVTSFDVSRDGHYLTTKSGILYKLKSGESTIVLNLNNDPNFSDQGSELGLMSVVSNNNFVYISYTIRDNDEDQFNLVVDEYSKEFKKIRTIIRILLTTGIHHAGTLVFDSFGKLYLSVGDGGPQGDPENRAQNLQSLRGKILRFDVSKTNPEPEIIAYGLRNPWKISIDSTNRMFVGDCGMDTVESVYLIDDLYPTTPYNLGWPVFEGTQRRRVDPLEFQNTLAPIYEYRQYGYAGGCVIGGYFLDEPEVYLFGDFFGDLRLLKEQDDGKWNEIYFQRRGLDNIYSFGYDDETKELFISGSSNIFSLTISSKQVIFLPQVILCRTTMPNGTINNTSCY